MLTQITDIEYKDLIGTIRGIVAGLASTDLTEKTYGITRTLTFNQLMRIKLVRFAVSRYCTDLYLNHLTEQEILTIINKAYDMINSLSASCGIDSAVSSGSSSIAPPSTTPLIYYTAKDVSTLPTELEIGGWSSVSINTGDFPILPFNNYNTAPKYLFWAEPATEAAKLKYYFSGAFGGDLGPDGPWALGIVVGSYRIYRTNYATQTGIYPTQFKTS